MAPKPDAPRIRLRRAGPRDLDAVWDLEQTCFEPHRRVDRRSLARSLASPYQRAWLLIADGRPAGTLILWMRPHTWRVYDIAIHPRLQGQGLGARLMDLAESQARRAGAHRIALEAAGDDARLLAFYRRRGYEVRRSLRGFYGPRRDAVRLEKRLGADPGRL